MTNLDEPLLSGRAATANRGATAPYVRLGDDDNVVVLARRVEAGDSFSAPTGEIWTMSADLDIGNKLAAARIAAGQRVIKLGMPIGTATQAIASGEHVHSHNLRSDYIATELEGETR